MLSCFFSSYSYHIPVYFTSYRHPEAPDQGHRRGAYRGTHLAHPEAGRGSFLLQAGGKASLQAVGMEDHQGRASEVVRQAYQQEAYRGKEALEAFRGLLVHLALPGEGYRLGHQRLLQEEASRACLGTEVACRQGKAGRVGRRHPGAGRPRDQEEFRRVGSEEAWDWRGLGLRRRTRR